MAFYLMKPLFPLGKICATPGAAALEIHFGSYLMRHNCGDWGDGLGEADATTNEKALFQGGRLFSCYLLTDGAKLCIVTDSSRSLTTIMLSDED